MKIRTGFVSNSSSSSFVVRVHEAKHGKDGKFVCYKNILTPTKEKKLRQFGFFKTYAYSPHQVPARADEQRLEEKDVVDSKYENFNYGYDITCNQDDVTHFLLKNRIPFVSEQHYGHRHVFYDGKDKVVEAVNFGVILSMYGVNDEMDTRKAIQTFTRQEYLKKTEW